MPTYLSRLACAPVTSEPTGIAKLAGSIMTASMRRANGNDLAPLRQILEAA